MKKVFWAVYLFFFLTVLSCDNRRDGGMDPIEFDKYELLFSQDGGEQELESTYYSDFFISFLEDVITGDYLNHPTSPASMEGIEIKIEGRKLIIKVSPSETPRCWKMGMWLMDAYSRNIWVQQKMLNETF